MESKMSRLQLSGPEDEDTKMCDWGSESDLQCEYHEDIWRSLLDQEAEKPQIHLTSPQLEFRGALVTQLRAARRQLRLGSATLHAAVQLLDMFMDRHELRTDRLAHSALACLSLAAKSEEKFSLAPRLSALSTASGVPLSGATLRRLEWTVARHVRWRLLMPTAATFAGLLARHVLTDDDLVSRDAAFVARFRRDGMRLLESYLDLSLSDVRLKVMGAADVGCACVACARAALGISAWPPRLAGLAGRTAAQLAPIARLLHGMMRVLKSRDVPDPGGAWSTSKPIQSSPDRTVGPTSADRTVDLSASEDRTVSRPAETSVVHRDRIPPQRDYAADLDIRSVPAEQRSRLEDGDCGLACYRSQRLMEAGIGVLEGKGLKRAACRDFSGFQFEKRYRVEVPTQRLL